MAGAVLSVGVVAGAALLAIGLSAAGSAAVVAQRAAGVADAAALAAADAASGAVPGIPCELAEQLASAAGMRLTGCDVDDLIATVGVSARFGALTANATARAGPPDSAGGGR